MSDRLAYEVVDTIDKWLVQVYMSCEYSFVETKQCKSQLTELNISIVVFGLSGILSVIVKIFGLQTKGAIS